jgi:hypothetical protein
MPVQLSARAIAIRGGDAGLGVGIYDRNDRAGPMQTFLDAVPITKEKMIVA